MRARSATAIMAVAVAVGIGAPAQADTIADFHFNAAQNYRQQSDSPFAWKLPEIGTDYWLEDLEDGAANTPGLDISNGAVRGPSQFTDSVDADGAGLLDNLGRDGRSWWVLPEFGPPSITVMFDAGELGGLPTMAGFVWTDGNEAATFTFEAFDADFNSLGSWTPGLGDGVHSGSTLADRFLGASYEGGISALTITGTFGGIEIDHIQYGGIVVPAPSVVGLLGLALLGGRRRRR